MTPTPRHRVVHLDFETTSHIYNPGHIRRVIHLNIYFVSIIIQDETNTHGGLYTSLEAHKYANKVFGKVVEPFQCRCGLRVYIVNHIYTDH